MPKLPLFLDVAGREIVIVGGGAVAARKIAVLARQRAKIVVISPDADPEIVRLVDEGIVEWRQKRYEEGDLSGAFLAIAATDVPAVNLAVQSDARAKNILVSVADNSGEGDFQLGAVIERGDIVISVSTGGKSPALSRIVRDRIEKVITPALVRLAEILGDLREPAKHALASDEERKKFFDTIIGSDIEQLLKEGKRDEARNRLETICNQFGVPVPGTSG